MIGRSTVLAGLAAVIISLPARPPASRPAQPLAGRLAQALASRPAQPLAGRLAQALGSRPAQPLASRPAQQPQPPAARTRLSVKPTVDFEVTGKGDSSPWQKSDWTALTRRQPDGHPYDARFKMLYSDSGLYFLMDGTDRTLTATMTEDFMDLWNEDVFEVFLWPDEHYPVYFEYEISPLNRELPIIIPNFGGQFLGWRPWHYEGNRLTRKATSTSGGPKEPHASIDGWRAEFFIPYALLRPLKNVPPKPGTVWRANFYRMDHDGGSLTQWGWVPLGNFHDYEKFGEVVFEAGKESKVAKESKESKESKEAKEAKEPREEGAR